MPIKAMASIFTDGTPLTTMLISNTKRRRKWRLQRVREQNEKNREESWDQWMTWCPQDFRSASIESIGARDPDVEKALNDAIAQSTPVIPHQLFSAQGNMTIPITSEVQMIRNTH